MNFGLIQCVEVVTYIGVCGVTVSKRHLKLIPVYHLQNQNIYRLSQLGKINRSTHWCSC
jgi:hypothetical protein